MKVQIYKSTSRYSLCQKSSLNLPTKLYSVFNIIENQLICIPNVAVKTNSFFVRFTAVEKQFIFSTLSFFCLSHLFQKEKKNSNVFKIGHFFSIKNYSNCFSSEFFSEKEMLKTYIVAKKFNPFNRVYRNPIKGLYRKSIRSKSKLSWFRFFGFFYYNDLFSKNNDRFVDYWNNFTRKNTNFSFKKTRIHNFFNSVALKNQKLNAKIKGWKKEMFKNKYTIQRRSNFRKKLKRTLISTSFLQNNTLFYVFNTNKVLTKKSMRSTKKTHRKRRKHSSNRFIYTTGIFKKVRKGFFSNKKYTFKVLKKNFKNVTTQDAISIQKNKNSLSFFYSSSTRTGNTKISALIQHKERENILRNILGTPVTLYRINALSFARFAFDWERKEKKLKEKARKEEKTKQPDKKASLIPNFSNLHVKYIRNLAQKNRELDIFLDKKEIEKKKVYIKGNKIIKSSKFLNALQDERRRRYRYVGVYIEDLIRLSFVAFYFKYAAFLIRFFAFTLRKLPRNRKETKFLRFLIKLVKVFGAQREEIVGLRVRFQGRVNRWRRTKHILGQKGILPLHTYTARVAYGYAQAITRKGAFGRRLWIAYEPFFAGTYKKIFFHYFQVYTDQKKSRFENIYKIKN